MGWILLATWIITGQPTNSYQTVFSSEATCKAAQTQVMNSAQTIKQQMWAEARNNAALQMAASLKFPHVSAVCSQQ
jgi:hypothetical protein